ncbi:MAG: glutathione S-transferase [Alphaproteobacteria bacterium]|nr:MAG: glutathione S-transferase [Alphaproteobacteria bacterium]
MKLYHRPDCPFCWKLRLFLREAGVEVSEISVKLGEKHPDVVALNPNGTVPVLIDGDLVLWESAVIIEYLADKFPETGLMTGTPEQRAKIRQIHSYSDHRLGKILFPYIKQVRDGKADGDLKHTIDKAWQAELDMLTLQLGDQDYFGPDFSVADCALIPRFTLALVYGLTLGKGYGKLKNWFERCKRRSSFATVLPASFPGIDEMIKLEIL